MGLVGFSTKGVYKGSTMRALSGKGSKSFCSSTMRVKCPNNQPSSPKPGQRDIISEAR